MKREIREALLELQDFHLWRGHTNKVAAIESLLNERREPTWYDFHCVKRAVKEFVHYNEYSARQSMLKESYMSSEMGMTIYHLESVCAFINLYRRAELDGGFLSTFDDYFADEAS